MGRQTGLFAGHEFERAVRAEVQHRIGGVVVAQVAVKRAESVGGGAAGFKQQAHRVAFIAKAWLHRDHHLAKVCAEHKDRLAVGQVLAGGRAPLRFDLVQPAFVLHMVAGVDGVQHIGLRAELAGVALQQAVAQLVHALRQLDAVAFQRQALQGVEERLEHRQIRGRAHAAGVGRKVEQHDGQLAIGAGLVAQAHQTLDAGGQHLGALGAGEHVLAARACGEGAALVAAGAGLTRRARAAAVHHGQDGAVEFGDRHHDGVFHRQQAACGAAPLLDGLKLQRVRGDVGHVEFAERHFGGAGVVVSRATHQGKTGERDQRLDFGITTVFEETVHRRAGIQATGKGGDDAQAARLQRVDDGVVMRGVACQQIRAQQQQAHGRLVFAAMPWQVAQLFADAVFHLRVVQAHLGVFDRVFRLGQGAQGLAGALGVAVHQGFDQVLDVVLGPGQPVAHGQEEQAQVLRGAGNETQQLGQAAQHGHLLGPGARRCAGLRTRVFVFGAGAQLFQQCHQARRLAAHDQFAHAGELRHLWCGHDADHGIAMLAARLQRVDHRHEVVFHEEHGDDDDVGLCHGGQAVGQGGFAVAPSRGAVGLQVQARQVARQALGRALGGAGQVAVHGQQHHAHARCLGMAGLSG